MKSGILIILFLLLLKPGYTQQTDFLFEHLTIDHGLSNNTVTSIARDHLGFMWFATNEGLTRFDGYDYIVYQHDRENTSTLSNNKIHCVYVDSQNTLWVGTRMGLNRYNRDLNNFTRFLNDPNDINSLSNNSIRTIYEDREGILWFGTLGGGLNKYDQATGKFSRYNFPDRNVSSIIEDSKGNFWVGTSAPALILFDWRNNAFTSYEFNSGPVHGLKPETGKTLYEDNQGNIWVCTEGAGLYRFNIAQKKFTDHFKKDGKGINSNIVSDIFQINNDQLWIATDGGGINIYNLKTKSFSYIRHNITDIKSLTTNAIYTFLQDQDDVIWIGTFGGGVNILNPYRQEFRFFTQRAIEKSSLNHKSVLSFHEDSKGRIWVGTDGGGLNLFDASSGTFKSFSHSADNAQSISSNVVTCIKEDSRGTLWVGTFAGGLNRFNAIKGNFERYQYNPADAKSIGSNNVWKLMEDKDNELWIGTLDGLEKYNYFNNTFTRIPAIEHEGNIFPGRVLSLFQDSRGNIWVGSTGLGILDKSSMEFSFPQTASRVSNELTDYDVRDIFEDKKGNIWIATEGAGLIMFDPYTGHSQKFTARDGLPGDAIHQIIQDDSGIFWLSTNKGISRFDYNGRTFSNYNVHDGLQSNQFAYSASLYSRSGEIYFGGVNGFNVFHPSRIKKNFKPPQVYITDFSLFNKPVEIAAEGSPLLSHILQTTHITLPYQSVFSFKFTAINYISTLKNSYKYKLEGFDDWNYVGNQRTATYTNINPGKYTFRVIAANNDGVWNEEGTGIHITILPPFWRTWIAYVLYIALFSIIFYFILRFVINRQKYKHDLMIKDLERNKSEEINQMKLRFFTNIAHEFRTPLTLILGPLDKIMSSQDTIEPSLKKQLLIMGRNTGRLLRLINELMEFRKIELGKVKLKVVKADLVSFIKDVTSVFDEHAQMHDIHFTFESKSEVLEAWFDKEKMEKVIYNILSNSFKFTPDCGAIHVRIDLTSRKAEGFVKAPPTAFAEIIIQDNGIGISPRDLPKIFDHFYQVKPANTPGHSSSISGTGIGLALSKELIELHKGEITALSEPGKGSTFRIVFPIDKKYFNPDIVVEQTTDDFTFQYSPGLYGIPHTEFNQYPGPAFEGAESGIKPVLLIIDDNPDMRSYLRSSLEESYIIYDAANGAEGLKRALDLMPDIIVSDVMMPEMDGIEFCRRIKQDINTSHLPVILLTAKTSDEFTMEGYDAGADDYVPKPFNPRLLHIRIKNILEMRHQLRDRFRKEGILQPSEVSVTSQDEIFLRKAMDVVEQNISNTEFRVSSFVSEMNMSRSVLYRKFEALTGHSVNEFVRNTRLKRAAQLLTLNELTVSEVSYEVGFNDPQYFSKCFNKFFGMTPSEYARTNAKKIVGEA
jgi:signal transduction histidine kinase/ligand-binding sensor domain-containing protein/DNA-binding response OmpR family regulator